MTTSPSTVARLAAAAAFLALSGATLSSVAFAGDSKAETVHCFGVNSCKGMSDCKSGNHDCKGQNSCKGQGFKGLSAEACSSAGGSTTEPAK